MRQLFVSVPGDRGEKAVEIARRFGAKNVSLIPLESEDRDERLLLAHVPNSRVESFLEELEGLGEIEITLNPRGIIALYPPVDEAPDQVVDVEMRSPLEIFLAGLQSIGSWTGFLSYAAAAGLIVWVGFFTNTIYLLIAAMLIAPYAGPAMNLAIGTARGDAVLIRRSLFRYFAGLAVSMVVAAVMTLLLRQEIPTSLMVDLSQVSSVAVILPLGIAHLVEASVRFTRAGIEGQNSLLCVIYVQAIGPEYDEDEVRSAVERAVIERLESSDFTPLLNVQVVSPGNR